MCRYFRAAANNFGFTPATTTAGDCPAWLDIGGLLITGMDVCHAPAGP
jgi:hypothetical protein